MAAFDGKADKAAGATVGDSPVKTWFKRIAAAEKVKEDWERRCRVGDCYRFWNGDQLDEPIDKAGTRKAIVNKIHPAVNGQIPALYYYKPFARVSAAAEKNDTPGTATEECAQLLQDTANFFARDPEIGLRENTFLALKEAFWSIGVVEVGYSAEWADTDKVADKPPLKEDDKTVPTDGEIRDEDGMKVGDGSDLASLVKLRDQLKKKLKREQFYVKHIPAKQFLCSSSDKPIMNSNDWYGYWEDQPLEDVKQCSAYKNTKDLKESSETDEDKLAIEYDKDSGNETRVRLYKLWSVRGDKRVVLAKGHDLPLLEETKPACRLKTLRFDIDPKHFYPRPVILDWLGPQDEYNDSREYLRQIRRFTRPRFTYDESAIDQSEINKFVSDDYNVTVARHSGTTNPIEPVQQVSYSDNALRTLTLSDKELADVGGIGGDPRISKTSTATQAKIAETKDLAIDSFDRSKVADFLAEIIEELVNLAIDYMSIDRWVAINVAPDSMFAPQAAQAVVQHYKMINAEKLAEAQTGIAWHLSVDVESLSPVSEEQKFQRWMGALQTMLNPTFARLAVAAPVVLEHTLELGGIRSAREKTMLMDGMKALVQMEMQLAAMGQNATKGVSPQAGSPTPASPTPQNSAPDAPGGGPQPGAPSGPSAPTGPGASAPR